MTKRRRKEIPICTSTESSFSYPSQPRNLPRGSQSSSPAGLWSALFRPAVAGIDQVLSARDVQRITGRHRVTIYRWVRAGTFLAKRAGGGRGWLRSDVERWLKGDGSGTLRP